MVGTAICAAAASGRSPCIRGHSSRASGEVRAAYEACARGMDDHAGRDAGVIPSFRALKSSDEVRRLACGVRRDPRSFARDAGVVPHSVRSSRAPARLASAAVVLWWAPRSSSPARRVSTGVDGKVTLNQRVRTVPGCAKRAGDAAARQESTADRTSKRLHRMHGGSTAAVRTCALHALPPGPSRCRPPGKRSGAP